MSIDLMSISSHKDCSPRVSAPATSVNGPGSDLIPLSAEVARGVVFPERYPRAPSLVVGFGEACRIAKEELQVCLHFYVIDASCPPFLRCEFTLRYGDLRHGDVVNANSTSPIPSSVTSQCTKHCCQYDSKLASSSSRTGCSMASCPWKHTNQNGDPNHFYPGCVSVCRSPTSRANPSSWRSRISPSRRAARAHRRP